MASWKKVIVSGSSAVLAGLTLDTDLAVSHGGTGASNAAGARSNLGLGTAAVLNTAAVANGATTLATGDQIYDHITTRLLSVTGSGNVNTSGTPVDDDFAKFTNATTIEGRSAAEMRTDLGLVIGTNVQAYDAGLADIAGLAVTNGNFIVGDGSNFVAESGATARTSLGLGSLATLSTINNGNWSGTDLAVANGGTGASSAGDARTNLGLAIGSDVQAYDAALAAIAGLATTDSGIIVGNGSTFVLESGATARTSLGVDAAGTDNSTDVTLANTNYLSLSGQTLTGGTVPIGSGGTGQTTAAAAANALLNTSQGGALTIGDGSDTITIAGNLTVSGDTTQLNVTNLNVEDKFINLNDGGSAADAGIVFEGQGCALGWDESASRLGFDFAGATQNQTTIAPDAYVSMVVTGSNASYQYNGNIKIESNDIYIYVE